MRTFDTSGGGATSREPAIPSKSQRRNVVPETPQAPSDQSQGTLTRRELAQAVYSVCPSVSRSQAKGFVDAVIEEIVSALAVGEDVSLRGFGKFAVREKPERTGSPEAVARLRFPQNVACGFPAPRSSAVDSQFHSECLQRPVGELQFWLL